MGGDPLDPETYIGPLTRVQQIEVLNEQVADALSKGARLLLGGKSASISGCDGFYEPTVLADADYSMEVMRDESFGPIVGIQRVEDDNEAFHVMDDTGYGLTAGVYCKERERAEKILRNIHTGTVYWNCCDRVSPTLPWSGRRGSGQGVTLSLDGIRTFLVPKAWHYCG